MAHAMEQALATNPTLARPLPDLSQLHTDRAQLKSIVTHPPMVAPNQ
jgi:hypothetical protein